MKVLLLKLKDAMIPPSLTNDDLLSIINGLAGTTPLQDPFVKTFTQDKITNCFSHVGYVLFTRNFLKIPYILHQACDEYRDS